jgi:hypothetical protein
LRRELVGARLQPGEKVSAFVADASFERVGLSRPPESSPVLEVSD